VGWFAKLRATSNRHHFSARYFERALLRAAVYSLDDYVVHPAGTSPQPQHAGDAFFSHTLLFACGHIIHCGGGGVEVDAAKRLRRYQSVFSPLRNRGAGLADSDTAMFAIVVVTLWQGLGGNIIIFLAGLQGIPPALYEAAKLDGANSWQLFQHITLPLLRTTTYLIAFLTLIGSLQLFDQAYAMTQGGPGYATTTAVYQIYSNGFSQLRMGYASAQAFVLALAILMLSIIQMRLNRDQAVY
jgi:hypothetical protein